MMTYNISFVLQLLITAAMNLFIFLFLGKVYSPKYENKFFYVAAYFLTTVLFIIVNRSVELIGVKVLNFVYGFSYIHILSYLLFKSDYKKTFMYNSLFVIALLFSDILTVAVLSAFKGETITNIAQGSNNIIVSHVVYFFMMFLVWSIFVSVLSKNNVSGIKVRQIILLGLFTIFETFVVDSYTQEVENEGFGAKIIIIIIGFLLLNVYLVYFIEQITKSYKEKYEYRLMKSQSKIQLDHYIEISKKYEESRKLIHDIKKHLATLNALKNNDDKQAKEYGLLIEKKVDSLFMGFQCSNNILSIIMEQKITAAESEMIKVNTQVEDILFDFVQDLDMTAIFANLWDNAIEANLKVEASERFINVVIGKVSDFIAISFENSFNGVVKKEIGNLLSTKANHEGVGMSIIKTSVEKYGGTLTIVHDKNIFKVDILIPVQ